MNANVNQPSNGVNLVELAERFGQYFIENIAAISIVVIIIISAMVYQQIIHANQDMDITENDAIGSAGRKSRTVVVETFDTMNQDPDEPTEAPKSLDEKMRDGFCKSHLGNPAELETACGKLSKDSCPATSCCVWAKMNSVESCVSGNGNGPIFKNEPGGAPKTLDYYYFENKCHGNNCPTADK
jgi:hypothetical protein